MTSTTTTRRPRVEDLEPSVAGGASAFEQSGGLLYVRNFFDDETYGKFYTALDIRVLLKTDHPKNNPDIAWATSYGNSRVFHLMLGHDGKAYANPNFRKLLHQGIRWAAGK